MARKSAREKLETKNQHEVVDDPRGKGLMLIPKATDFEDEIKKIKKGKLVTVGAIRSKLAHDYRADFTCPLVSGIFVRLVAEAAEEDYATGKADIAPYWRVIKDDGALNEKFPGGVSAQANKLEKEGFEIVLSKGKKPPKVKDYEKFLQDIIKR